MRGRCRRAGVAALMLAGIGACADFVEADPDGPVALIIYAPATTALEQGQHITLRAEAVDRHGLVLDVPLAFRTPDTTLMVEDASGEVTALRGVGTGRVQVRYDGSEKSLISDFISFTLVPRADTLIRVGPDSSDVAVTSTGSVPLAVRLESDEPAGPLANRPIVYEVIEPAFADPDVRTVELSSGVLLDTLTTGSDGTPALTVTLQRRTGIPAPQRAVVEARAFRAGGDPVPGSGIRFVIRFIQP